MFVPPPPSEFALSQPLAEGGAGPLDPHLPMLVRVTGRTMLIVFVVVVLTSMLPLSPRSPVWGVQLSTRIIEVTSFAMVGVACLRFASFLEPIPDYAIAPQKAMQVARRRDGALRFCRLGVISLALLALWQVVLLFSNLAIVDRENAALSGQLRGRIGEAEKLVSEAPGSMVQQQWQQLTAAKAPGFSPAISAPEQQRQALLSKLRADQKKVDLDLIRKTGQARFDLLLSTFRRLALCAAFIIGFFALGRRCV